MTSRLLLFAGLLCLLAVARVAANEGEQGRHFWIAGWVTLSGQGQVTGFEFDPEYKLPDALKEPADALVRATQFEPASVQGQGRPSRSWMRAGLRLQARDDSYAVALESPHLGPRPHSHFYPRGIRPPTRPARMVLAYTVNTEGRTQDIRVLPLDGRLPAGLPKALEDRVRSLRFDPVEVDGAAIATQVHQPMAFSKVGMDIEGFDLPPLARDPGQPGAAGQSAYSPELVFSAKQIFHGSFRP
ncbi:hypothetical protein GCM10011521_00430 [Arenimonas soli]|uniref:TonB C-terminal domain-containing protein n=1 Tax=Arenimonas soli TaxID=2269504 RepID=A0ABQ1H9Z1_9GAMM|nr:hypothetical protein [Arenimonas soli]GGA66273.1 hypothetical protein GCM10011521_00430 [Arenimonas soli]